MHVVHSQTNFDVSTLFAGNACPIFYHQEAENVIKYSIPFTLVLNSALPICLYNKVILDSIRLLCVSHPIIPDCYACLIINNLVGS